MSTPTIKLVLETESSTSGLVLPGIEAERKVEVEGRVPHHSPACRLPFDIMESIFLSCFPDEWHWICHPRHPSVVLSRVCSSWRSTALQCPKLWAQLRIPVPNPESEAGYTVQWHRRMEQVGKALEIWANRSGTSPIEIAVTVRRGVASTTISDVVKAAYLTLIHAIKRTSTRWSALHFTMAAGSDCEILLDLMRFTPASLPLLAKVSLDVATPSSTWKSILHLKLQDLLSSSGLFLTPSLRSLTLHGVWGAPTTIHLWPPLTHLELTCYYPQVVSVMSLFELFRQRKAIPTLEEVSTAIRGHHPDTNPNPNPLEFPNLKRLTLTGSRFPKGFGPCLSLPALHELNLQFQGHHGINSELVAFVVHLGTQLKTLTLFSDSINRQALIKISENVPRLESLALDARTPLVYRARFPVRSAQEPGVDCYAITELNVVGSSVVGVDKGVADEGKLLRCPQLSKLELGISRDRYKDDAVEQELVELIGSRRGTSRVGVGENMLQAVSISYQRVRGFGAKGVLGTLEERGIDLDGFTLRVSTYK